MAIKFLSTVLSALTGKSVRNAELEAQRILGEAEEQKRRLLLEGREEILGLRSTAEVDVKERLSEVREQERRQQQKEEGLDRRIESLERRETSVDTKEKYVDSVSTDVERLKGEQIRQLESIAALTASDARNMIMARAETDMKHELAKRYYELENQMRQEVDEEAKKVITLAIQRLAADVVSERSTSRIPLPDDAMKGRLIGREGRNIRAIEAATGVDILIDDTPEMVTVSCFDPIRREVARLALEKLIVDGRIHPARIEDVVAKSRQEVEETIHRCGEEATLEAGVKGLNPELKKLLGRLKYRYSYGENILQHSVEVSLLSGLLASEIGADADVAKAGGLLHDIGKAMTHEVQGSHVDIGGEIAEKYGIAPEVHRAIVEHHDDDRGSIEALIVAAADAISAARPGARKESLDQYVERLEGLEDIATSFDGVEKAYAIHAGREVRIIVKPDDVDDFEAAAIARDVAKRVEDEMVYPGQVKVTVVRETRKIEIAH